MDSPQRDDSPHLFQAEQPQSAQEAVRQSYAPPADGNQEVEPKMKHTHSTAGQIKQDWEEDDIQPQSQSQQEQVDENKCLMHGDTFILFCLKD